MLKGKTKSGVAYKIDIENIKKVEWKITKTMMRMQTGNPEEQVKATLELMDLILGGSAGVDAFENAIAKAHDGYLTNEIVLSEYRELIQILGDALKNSQASHTS